RSAPARRPHLLHLEPREAAIALPRLVADTLPARDHRRAGSRVVSVRRRPEGRPRLLLVAYACLPDGISESAVGWRRALDAGAMGETGGLCEGGRRGPAL